MPNAYPKWSPAYIHRPPLEPKENKKEIKDAKTSDAREEEQ